jgi:ABC-type nickel/cobalt efflux system permease component RcnA
MSPIPSFLAASTLADLMGPSRPLSPLAYEFLLFFGAVVLVTLLALIWAAFLRRKRRRQHSHHHEHRHSSPSMETSMDANDADAPARPEKRRRRRHGRQHRPRNPTLAETGGLPPIRPEDPSEPRH